MNPLFFSLLSIICQVYAALAALRLIRLTGRTWAWFLIASALLLMIIRRLLALWEILFYGMSPLEVSTELVPGRWKMTMATAGLPPR